MNPPAPPPHRTVLDIAERALSDSRVRRDALIALAMILLAVVLSAWLLATAALLTLGGVAAGISAGRAARRRR